MPILTERERVGTRLAGKYDLGAILGRGGMGTVFAGTHAWTGRRVAVKLLRPTFAEDANVVRRFLREARAASAIRHPHVVDVLDMGQEDDGTVYMVLELLEGESLGALLRRRGRLEADELLPLLLPIADALVDVHAAGLVHRDLKPENIFVTARRGRTIPKLLDFGIAKLLEDSTQAAQKTRTGAIVGTPHYMSPEQASGSRDVGPASDVWSFGVVFYECLTGALPFDAENATGVLVRILTSTAPPLSGRSDVPAEIARVVDRAMQPDRAHRFLDMRSMRDALRDAARALGIAIPDTVPDEEVAPVTADLDRPSTGEIIGPIDVAPVAHDRGAIESAPTLASADRAPSRDAPPRASVPAAPSVQIVPSSARRVWVAAALGALVLLGVGLAIGRGLGTDDDRERAAHETTATIVPDASVAATPPPTLGVPATEAAPVTDRETETGTESDPGTEPGTEQATQSRRAARRERAPRVVEPRPEPTEAARAEPEVAAEPEREDRPEPEDGPVRRPGVRDEW